MRWSRVPFHSTFGIHKIDHAQARGGCAAGGDRNCIGRWSGIGGAVRGPPRGCVSAVKTRARSSQQHFNAAFVQGSIIIDVDTAVKFVGVNTSTLTIQTETVV